MANVAVSLTATSASDPVTHAPADDMVAHKYPDGTEFELSREHGTKTRTGETEKSTNSGVFKPKMWATPDRPEGCPCSENLSAIC